MKRDKSDNGDEEKRSDKRRDSQDNEDESNDTDKRPKLDASLDLKDLGAGYEAEDRKVARAINIYETKLLPYIEQNSSIFKKSNFLALRGYAVGVAADKTANDN